jgi:flagellar hook-associated protein 1
MSISLLMGNAVSALQTNQAAMSVTANNIANVNTPDYARRQVNFNAAQAGDNMAGVNINEVRRITNEFLAREVLSMNSGSQYYNIQQEYQDRLQSVIGSPDQERSLAGLLTNLMAQFNEVAIDPTSLPRKADLMSDLDQLAKAISGLAGNIQSLRSDADQQIIEKINQVNNLTSQIFDLNRKIQSSVLAGADPSALEDQRDSSLKELAGLLEITVTREANGGVMVSTASGISLVGAIRYELQYTSNGLANPSQVFPQITVHRVNSADGVADPNGQDFNQHLGSGQLGGLINMRDVQLPEIAKELGALSSTVIDALNGVHNDNISFPAPNSLTGVNTGLLSTDSNGFTGLTQMAIVDENGALVRRVDIDFNTGTYSVDGAAPVGFGGTSIGALATSLTTALGGMGTVSFNNGVMSVSATSPNQGIGFLQDDVDPSGRGGRGFSHFFGLNNIMDAKAPAQFETGLGLTDAHGFVGGPADFQLRSADGRILKEISITPAGVSVGDLLTTLNDVNTGLGAYGTFGLSSDGQVSFTTSGLYQGAVLASQGDTTSRGGTGRSMTDFFGLGEASQMNQAVGVMIDPVIGADQRFLGLAKLDLSPATVVGDIVVTQSDSRGAAAFNNIQNQTFSIPAAGQLVAMNVTLGQYTSTFLADTGQRASQTQAFAASNMSLFAEVEARQANERGVSLDEELSNMMIYQQSYNAAARMVTTAKEIYDVLLSIA